MLEGILIGMGLVLVALGCLSWNQPRVMNQVSYWHQSISGLHENPSLFYAQVYQRLQDGLQAGPVPLGGFGFGPTHLFETNWIFNAHPLYLEARYKHVTFYLYVAATPAGLFVSHWTFSKYTLWLEHPVLKWFVLWYLRNQTLFQFDAVLMLSEALHGIVLEVVDGYIKAESLQPLEELERRPTLHSFYGAIAAPHLVPPTPKGASRRLPIS
ncbi:MAG: hypothetical protein JOZ57_10900 [Abitibacteriaceae bacterium]|nr:hypothetical protein [Abditibacteriaceae bacterium]